MPFCANCGVELNPGQNFCHECGFKPVQTPRNTSNQHAQPGHPQAQPYPQQAPPYPQQPYPQQQPYTQQAYPQQQPYPQQPYPPQQPQYFEKDGHRIPVIGAELAEAPNRAADPDEDWYILSEGEVMGPYDASAMMDLADTASIQKSTPVWHPTQASWEQLDNTRFEGLGAEVLPPNPVTPWLVAIAPVFILIADIILVMAHVHSSFVSVIVAISINTGLAGLDLFYLKKANQPSPNSFWVFLVPVYLFQRRELLNQPYGYFTTWLVLFILKIIIF